MGKRSREKRLRQAAESVSGPAAIAAQSTNGPDRTSRLPLSGWRRAALQLAITLLAPVALLALIEAALRLCGYGYSTRFFEPSEDGQKLSTNPKFAWRFYLRETSTAPVPLTIAARKPPGTRRIVVLGESAAAGTPDPAFSFSRMLEFMLRQQFPSNRFEVINAAMRGVNSHIVLPIARECAGLSPDLFVVYMGNNEQIGLHSPSPDEINFTRYLRLLRIGDAIKTTRLAQLTQSLLRRFQSAPERKMQEMDYLRRQRIAFDDPGCRAVHDNFRANLEDICRTAQRSGAPAILVTVGVNLHDFPPLGSLHRHDLTPSQLAEWEKAYSQGVAAETRNEPNEAIQHFEAARRLDDHFAELHFHLARDHERHGEPEPARQHYNLAHDQDALQFRADRRLNEIVRQIATNRQASGVVLADAARAFDASALAENGVPGRALFNDHVHFSFDGDYQLATFLLPSVGAALRLENSRVATPSRDDCARALAYTPVDEMNVLAAMAQQTSRPPFLDQLEHLQRQAEADRRVAERRGRITAQDFEQASAVYREALARAPDDWMLHFNFGNLLNQFSQSAPAVTEYEFVVKRLPRHPKFHFVLGNALLQSGRPTDALAQYRAALDLDPEFSPAREAIVSIHRKAR